MLFTNLSSILAPVWISSDGAL